MRPLKLKPKKHIKKIPKKKRKYKVRRGWNDSHGITMMDIENINDVLYAQKSQIAERKGAWKVVPKDSCEVYKERRKRRIESESKDDGVDKGKPDCRKSPKHNDKLTRKNAARNQRRRSNKKRYRHDSSSTSCTSRTGTESSCSSLSEMEDD